MSMLERIRFMKVNKHKRFEYTPRYYDERKERIENLKKIYSDEEEANSVAQKENLRQQINQAWRGDNHSKQKNAANIRLVIILAVILIVVYYIFGFVDTFSADVTNIDNP